MYYNSFGYCFDSAMWMRIEILDTKIYHKFIFQNNIKIYKIVAIILLIQLFYY